MSIAIRKKKLADGSVSLYLDIYQQGKRHYEFLNLYLTKDRTGNKETSLLARSIAARRQLEVQNSEHGFIPQFKKKANFVQYFERLANDKPHRSWRSMLKILREFTNGQIQFSAISEEWLEELKRFILTKVSQNSGHNYFQRVKAALNQAVKDNILLNNPSQQVPQIKMQETYRSFLTIDEIQKLAATPCRHPDVKRAFLFSCYTGLRFSDVKALTWVMSEMIRSTSASKKHKEWNTYLCPNCQKTPVHEGRCSGTASANQQDFLFASSIDYWQASEKVV